MFKVDGRALFLCDQVVLDLPRLAPVFGHEENTICSYYVSGGGVREGE